MTDSPRSQRLSKLRVERLANPGAIAGIMKEWEDLDSQLSPRTPFTSALWNTLWWKHFGEQRLALRDEFFVHVVRDPAGSLVAIAPMVITHRPGIGMLGVRSLQFFGADANVTELRGLVCRVEHQAEVMSALSRHFADHGAQWDWLQWHGVRDDAVWGVLPNSGEVQRGEGIPDYCLAVPDTWEAFRGGLSRNIKESLRKCYNSLKRDGHSFVFRAVERPDEARKALDRFFELHAARASREDSIRHVNVFEGGRARDFLMDFTQHMAEAGKLRIFQLDIGGKVVATRVAFALGDELYLYFSGYDPDWGKYSVMTTVVAEAIKWSIENGFKLVNLSPGSDVSKLRWGPKEIRFWDAVQLSQRRRGRVAFHAYQTVVNRAQTANSLSAFLRSVKRKH